MKISIVGILLAIILALVSYLPVLAQSSSGTITITMTGTKEISITLEPTTWSPEDEGTGVVSPNKEYITGAQWCTMTAGGNCDMKTYIAADDAVCAGKPSHKWTLSSDGNNDVGVYALWFEVDDAEHGDQRCTLIPEVTEESLGESFWPYAGGSDLSPGDTKHFGLKLLTPQPDFIEGGTGYFSTGGATMETTITISAVAA
jgi:hypothetical protein